MTGVKRAVGVLVLTVVAAFSVSSQETPQSQTTQTTQTKPTAFERQQE